MRLVTWNCCRGTYASKAPRLARLAPDITVLQECARPPLEGPRLRWFGDNPRQGIAVAAAGRYRLEPLPARPGVPRFVVPLRVTGPRNFTLLAVWAKADRPHPYVEGVLQAVEIYADLLAAGPAVLVGDTNSNAIWDHQHHVERSHSALVRRLAGLGLVSAYHAHHGEEHGRETRPTYYFRWNQATPFHLDYCFIPAAWRRQLARVTVGTFGAWRQYSDHRPLLVEVSARGRGGPVASA